MIQGKILNFKDFDGSLADAALLLSKGNAGALTNLIQFLTYLEVFSYESESDKWIRIMQRLRVFDKYSLLGEQYWYFYANTCKKSMDNLFAFTQAYINHSKYSVGLRQRLRDHFEKNSPFDFDKLFLEVKLTEPACFDNPELVEQGEDKEITTDLLAGLKNKFNRK